MQLIPLSTSLITIKTPLQPLILLTHQIPTKTHLQKTLISSKWGKRRSGSRRSHKKILNSIAFIASNLNILPEPLDSLMREFWVVNNGGGGGKNGGNFWFKNGFGSGGNGRNKREKLGFWVPLLISSGFALWVVLEKESEKDLLFWILLGVFGFAFCLGLKMWRKEIKDWILGFCCGVSLMGLGLRNNGNLGTLVENFRVSSSRFVAMAKKRRRGRRWI